MAITTSTEALDVAATEPVGPERARFHVSSGLVAGVLLPAFLVWVIFLSLDVPLDQGRFATTLSWVVIVVAVARLTYLAATGTPAVLDISFWCFVLVFFGISAVVQLHDGSFPLPGGGYTRGEVAGAQIRVLVGCLAYAFGRRVVPARRERRPLRWQLSAPRARRLGYFGLVALGLAVALRGLKPFFTSRDALTGALLNASTDGSLQFNHLPDKAGGLLLDAAVRVPVLIAVCVLLRPGASRRGKLLILALLVGNLIANNPIGNARYWFGTAFVAFCATRIRFDRKWMAAGFILGALSISLFAYAYLDLFRRTGGAQIEQGTPAQLVRSSVDFGMFQQELNASRYVDRHGILFGRQLTGTVFLLVPRKVWPDKPVDTGDVIGSDTGFNVAASLWSEMYVDFGYLGVAVGFAGLGMLFGALDRRFAEDGNEVLLAFLPPLAAFEIFFLRGSLQPAWAELLPVLACMAYVTKRRVVVPDG
jgi:hypothetical protein